MYILHAYIRSAKVETVPTSSYVVEVVAMDVCVQTPSYVCRFQNRVAPFIVPLITRRRVDLEQWNLTEPWA